MPLGPERSATGGKTQIARLEENRTGSLAKGSAITQFGSNLFKRQLLILRSYGQLHVQVFTPALRFRHHIFAEIATRLCLNVQVNEASLCQRWWVLWVSCVLFAWVLALVSGVKTVSDCYSLVATVTFPLQLCRYNYGASPC